jgi:aspartate-semialdehyde dehydrogenase
MEKVKVGILGVTGAVGQRFVQLLEHHPYFDVVSLGASAERSAGKSFAEAVEGRWKISADIPAYARELPVTECAPEHMPETQMVFSGLDAKVAGEIEERFAQAGKIVLSNARSHRWDPDVPIMSAEVNPEHLEVLKDQKWPGAIVTNSNCTIMGVTITLKALMDEFGIEQVFIASLQAISGAGYPGLPSMDILGNVIPYIGGEEPKAESEPLKCLGRVENGRIVNGDFVISAHCNRVPVFDGHTVCVSVKLKRSATPEQVREVFANFEGEPQRLDLPQAPKPPIVVRDEDDRPQTRLDVDAGNGMAVVVGRVRECSIFGIKYVTLSHNTVRGAAGASLLNAELMYRKGLVKA